MNAWLERNGSRYTLGVHRQLSHRPCSVWDAIVDRSRLAQWFPCDIEGGWGVGAALRFTFLHGEGGNLPEEIMRGQVLEVDEERLLGFRWGDHDIQMRLQPADDGCRFVLTDTFDDPGIAARSAAGWEACLDNLLRVTDGEAPRPLPAERWQPLFDAYRREFEPEFGAQHGPPEGFEPRPEQDGRGS